MLGSLRPSALALALALTACTGLGGLTEAPDAGAEDAARPPIVDASTLAADASIEDSGPPCGGADLATDAKNCGRCKHDCLGGACKLGKCQPVQIAAGDQTPRA